MKSSSIRYVLAFTPLLLTGCGGFAPALIGEQRPKVRVFNGVDGQTISVAFNDIYGDLLGTSPSVNFPSTSATPTIISNTNAVPTISSGGTTLFVGTKQQYQINAHYTLYVGGTTGKYFEVAVADNSGEGPTAGDIQLRAVHVGVNVSAVDLYVVPTGNGVSGASLINSLTYAHVSGGSNTTGTIDNNGYVADPVGAEGTYDVLVTNHNSVAPICKATVTLNPKNYYTAVIYDSGAGAGVQVLTN